MNGAIRTPLPGFRAIIAASLALHVVLIAMSLLVLSKRPTDIFKQPVYTVSLIDPVTLNKNSIAGSDQRPRPENVKPLEKVAPKPKEEAAKTPAVKKEAVRKEANPKTAEKEISIKDSIDSIKKSVKSKEEAAMLNSRIEELKKKQAKQSLSGSLEALRNKINKEAQSAPPPQARAQGSGAGGAEFNSYYAVLKSKIDEAWEFPGEFKSEIRVTIRIGRSGELLGSWIEKTSGSVLFDESLLAAIKKAAPFPPLPENHKGRHLETGLRFCPEGCE